MKDLTQLRQEIDELDAVLLGLLAKRIGLIEEVGNYKKQNGIQPHQPGRWQQVLESRERMGAAKGLSKKFVADIWNRIHEEALEIEGKIVA